MFELDEKIVNGIKTIINQPSFYPNQERKTREERISDMNDWFERYGEVNEFYNVWGLDIKGAPQQDIYLDHGIFRKQRYELNSKFLCSGDSFTTNYTVVMRDKSLFEAFASQFLPRSQFVKSYGVLKGNLFISHEKADESFDDFISKHDGEKLIFKRSTGCSGKGVYVCNIIDGRIKHKDKLFTVEEFIDSITDNSSTWMIQPFVKQHPFMGSLNPETVNIIRMVTFNTGRRVFFVPSMLVYARDDTEVCNSDQGSYYVGISVDGIVENDAIDRFENKLIHCPVAGQKIPYWDEVINLAKKLHSAIPELFTIGWDITITEEGPLVFEGNDGWCPYVNEWSPETALRKTWEDAVEERKLYYGI